MDETKLPQWARTILVRMFVDGTRDTVSVPEFCRAWEVGRDQFRAREREGLAPRREKVPGVPRGHPVITRKAMVEWLGRLARDREREGRPLMKWPLKQEAPRSERKERSR